MAKLPEPQDPTLLAVDRAIEARENARQRRTYLGFSAIGRPCARDLWYDFRWAFPVTFSALSHKRFEDGHKGEDIQAERLRLVEGITLITLDPETGKQLGCMDHDGHFRGHKDGHILGILQAPKTWHIWEHKQVGEDKQRKLEKLKHELGEKNALRAWDEVYYAQAQLYMAYTGFHRHYLTASSPGGRHTVSCRTEFDPDEAVRQREKAKAIIDANRPPAKLSERPDWWQCKMCSHAPLCHGDAFALRNCRTCIYAAPVTDGNWHCGYWNDTIPAEVQRSGCERHRYIPDLVPGEQVDAAEDAEWIDYRLRDGQAWSDGSKAVPE